MKHRLQRLALALAGKWPGRGGRWPRKGRFPCPPAELSVSRQAPPPDGGAHTAREPGFGITVVPLQYVSATTLGKLLDSFAVKPGSVRVDPQRNIVVVQGSGADRRNAVETVMSFDADWLRGQSVGIYPVRNSTPEPIISELERIMDSGEGSLSASLVKLQPIARLNAVMVI